MQEGELHRADVDVAATLAVLRALCEKYPELGQRSLTEMHHWQVDGHRSWAESFREFLKSTNTTHDGVELEWPHRRPAVYVACAAPTVARVGLTSARRNSCLEPGGVGCFDAQSVVVMAG